MDKKVGTDADVRVRIGKARAAFKQLKNVWKASKLTKNTKLRLFKPVLLYGVETWRTTLSTMNRLQTFINVCLRIILKIEWPEKISNQELRQQTKQMPVEQEILQRRWGWVGHTLRKPGCSTTRRALTWNPQGKRKRGRPRNTWRRDLEADTKRLGHTWKQLESLAGDRDAWWTLSAAFAPQGVHRPKSS